MSQLPRAITEVTTLSIAAEQRRFWNRHPRVSGLGILGCGQAHQGAAVSQEEVAQ